MTKSYPIIMQDFSIAGITKEYYRDLAVKNAAYRGINSDQINNIGCKTETRRLTGLKQINKNPDDWGFIDIDVLDDDKFIFQNIEGDFVSIKCPFGDKGDKLNVVQVKETRISKYYAGDDGNIYRLKSDGEFYPLKYYMAGYNKQYQYVSLQIGGSQKKNITVHSLVCEAFHGQKPDNDYEVRHLDGVYTNNFPENLDWGTKSDNARDQVVHRRDKGNKHFNEKLSDEEVALVKSRFDTIPKMAKSLGVSKNCVECVLYGQPDRKADNYTISRNFPSKYSRITLTNEGVTVERLHNINTEGAMREGFSFRDFAEGDTTPEARTPSGLYREAWIKMHGQESWDSSPWVWVLKFSVKEVRNG